MDAIQIISVTFFLLIVISYFLLKKILFDKEEYRYKNYDEILGELSLSIELNPKDHLSLYERGKIKLKQNKVNESIDDFKKAYLLGNNDAKEYLRKIAPSVITDLLQKNDEKSDSNLLKIEDENDFVKKSLVDFDKLIKSNPSNAVAYLMRGDLKEVNDDTIGALMDFTEATKVKPDYTEAYLRRGKLKLKLLDKKGACKDFKKAVELGSEQAEKFVEKYC